MSEGIVCPLECINRDLICESPSDWLEKHSTFVITLFGLLGGGATMLLTYFLKSRCKKIKCCGFECDRTPIELTVEQVEMQSRI